MSDAKNENGSEPVDTPAHDPSVGDWYYFTTARELCCIVRIESWSEPIDDMFGEVAMLVYEDGTVSDQPTTDLRDDPHYLPVDRPDVPVTPSEMEVVIERARGKIDDIDRHLIELGIINYRWSLREDRHE